MAKIITKHSTSSSSVPSGLTTGELAVNITDKELFVGAVAGTVSLTGVKTYNGVTGAVQGVSSANGFTGAVTWGACSGLAISSSGGSITYGIASGYALLRSVGTTGDLENIDDQQVGDLVFVQDPGTYYYWDFYTATSEYKWINISLVSNILQGDLNLDGTVNGADLAILLGSWGVINAAPLNIGVQDGATGSFKIYAAGVANPKKADMVRVSTEGLTSQFLVNTDNIILTGLAEIDGEDADAIALHVYNGKTLVSRLITDTGIEIIGGGISGGYIDGGSYT